MTINILIQIGNSDDKLPQARWATFISGVRALLEDFEMDERIKIHGEWFSKPDSPWQNANWCVEPVDDEAKVELQTWLPYLCQQFDQESIAWTEGEVKFIGPRTAD